MALPVWARDTLDRAWRTWVQTFLGAAGYTGIETRFDQVAWLAAAQIATIATIFAFLMALLATTAPVGQPGTAAFVSLEPARSVTRKAARQSRQAKKRS